MLDLAALVEAFAEIADFVQVGEGIDVRRAGIVGEITQSRLNASAAANAAGGSGVVWSEVTPSK